VVEGLFWANALRLFCAGRARDALRADKLAQVTACARRAIAVAPLMPSDIETDLLDAVHPAPPVHAPMGQAAAALTEARGPHPADGVLMIGDTALERDWSAAARFAGYLTSQRYFG